MPKQTNKQTPPTSKTLHRQEFVCYCYLLDHMITLAKQVDTRTLHKIRYKKMALAGT